MIGLLYQMEEGKLTYGSLQNDQTTDCPVESDTWREAFQGEWVINKKANLTNIDCEN